MKLPIKITPYNHQVTAHEFALDKFEEFGCAALLMDMGLGKSVTSIAVIGSLLQDSKVERALVICPTSIISVWQKEFNKFADYNFNIEVIVEKNMLKLKKKLKLLLKKI